MVGLVSLLLFCDLRSLRSIASFPSLGISQLGHPIAKQDVATIDSDTQIQFHHILITDPLVFYTYWSYSSRLPASNIKFVFTTAMHHCQQSQQRYQQYCFSLHLDFCFSMDRSYEATFLVNLISLEIRTFFSISYVETLIHPPYTVLDGVFSSSSQILYLWNALIYQSSLLPGLQAAADDGHHGGRFSLCFSFGCLGVDFFSYLQLHSGKHLVLRETIHIDPREQHGPLPLWRQVSD